MDAATAATGAVSIAQAVPVPDVPHFGFWVQMGIDAGAWILLHCPWAAPIIGVLFVLQMARPITKLTMTFLHDITKMTPSHYDDDLLASWEASKVYTAFCYILDVVASIKLPAPTPKA